MTKYARVVAVANQKGGVAKTTTAINLAASLALANQRILLVDMDPQSNLTSGLGLKGRTAPDGTIYDVLSSTSADPTRAVLSTSIDHLSIVPADRNLTGAEIELVAMPDREYRLRRLLDPLRPRFDFIFIDTPPSLGLLTLNALVAADTVLVPLNCEYFALEGIAELLSTIDRVRAALNPALAIEGVLLTMYDDRTNLGQQVSANIREFFGDQVYRTVIPRNIRLGEAPSHGVPVILYDARSRGAEAYVNLAQEFIARTRVDHGADHLDHEAHGDHGEKLQDVDHGAHGDHGEKPQDVDHGAHGDHEEKLQSVDRRAHGDRGEEPAGMSARQPPQETDQVESDRDPMRASDKKEIG